MIDHDPYLISNCIIAENRKKRPEIDENSLSCPFCLGHEEDIEEVRLETKDEAGNFLIKIVNNKYPICTPLSEPYGIHDVVIDTPNHLEKPKDFLEEHWRVLLQTMQARWREMVMDPKIEFIQVFKNYGKAAGASISHSHWQMVALSEIPYHVALQYEHYNAFYKQDQSCYICHMLKELPNDLIILQNETWVVVAPKASQFAHETWLIPRRHSKHFGDLNSEELYTCSLLLKKLLMAYDELLKSDSAFNICFMSGGIKNTIDYHFYIKMIPRINQIAGFELATNCYFNTVHPKTHVQLMKNILEE